LLAVLAGSVSAQSPGSEATAEPARRPLAAMPANQPDKGLVYDGLDLAASGPCVGMYAIAGTDSCTHGPDPLPPGKARFVPAPLVDGPAANQPQDIICEGNGQAGRRVQVMYVRAANAPDRYASVLPSLKQRAAEMDQLVLLSAQETGGSRRIRFVTDAAGGGCVVNVLNVVIPPDMITDVSRSFQAIATLGYKRTDRKYVMFVDSFEYCGIADIRYDDRPGPTNLNNDGPTYARVDRSCWYAWVGLHELGHTIGAVQDSAPHSTRAGHCTDEYDVMCYSDAPYYPPLQYLCPETHQDLLDCNHDDYFHTNPPPGSYLASHWNSANAGFLIGAPPAQPAPPNGLAITFSGRRRARITWEDSDGETSYTLWRYDRFSRTPIESRLAANVTAFEETALLCGQSYTYQLSANNEQGASSPSRLYVYAGIYPSCDAPDDYEPDNSAAEAGEIVSGERQIHNLYPASDIDRVTFSVAERAQVVLKIGYRDRSTMVLLDGSGGFLDSTPWPEDPAVIRRDCRGTALEAGTYSALVHSPAGNALSADYTLSLDIVACADLHWAFLPRIGR
jgi:hypothetical protein